MESVIEKPLITEKTLAAAANGWYTFVVHPRSTKGMIARDITSVYRVTVTRVRTSMVRGHTRRVGRRGKVVRKPDWKKATVHLAKDQKIDAFEVSGEKK